MSGAPEGKRKSKRIRLGKSGSASQSEGMNLQFSDSDLNDSVRSEATPKPTAPPEEEVSLKSRLDQIAVGSKAYAKEYRLKAVHKLLMRNIPLDTIAKSLEVSVHTVMRDRKDIRKRLQEEAKQLDINHMIGDTLAYYQEIQALSLKEASSARAPTNMRLAALRTALAAKNDQTRFLASAGVLDVLRYQAAETEGQTDIEKMVHITEAIMNGDDLQSVANDILGEEELEVSLL